MCCIGRFNIIFWLRCLFFILKTNFFLLICAHILCAVSLLNRYRFVIQCVLSFLIRLITRERNIWKHKKCVFDFFFSLFYVSLTFLHHVFKAALCWCSHSAYTFTAVSLLYIFSVKSGKRHSNVYKIWIIIF